MEDISENLTLTDSESTKKKRKKALIIPDELKTITKGFTNKLGIIRVKNNI